MLPLLYHKIDRAETNALLHNRGLSPVYTASAKSRIVLVGQAPGRIAQETRKPWNDASGRLLRKWLGVTDEQFYNPDLFAIMPMDFYYPGKGAHGDLPPRKEFAPTWHPKLLALMPDVRLTILVGAYAQKYYLGMWAERNLTETVKNFNNYLPEYFPLVHPSPLNFGWRKHNPWFEKEVIPLLQVLVQKAIR
ncbi:uracil-DNA glycosylase family protein [Treponema socranskii subsp. socranskii VPI DR56BR1116 = ATCC 35536]|uniref:Uracil-DNA glycosylase family protein n=1 Tax=Treponema socranskii subsp. socranskii VPI DR56BR1116 = ATCC 35536 TaxID=1125725 RepID=U1GXX6_TRESO|nr:uracil-DNA glycosylase family protein [Treponema socranskii]ERF61409.1 uracil-DNA glycosylase family protein [Treponema socranskii subsp. socranskii VPI DR56BR1116 = ATCC 35536]ERK04510.1 uracil-DNA glycosylase family protein [Treponema socranskii subsp. socranskii VPI DR56BR1116 = ATCC 35536]